MELLPDLGMQVCIRVYLPALGKMHFLQVGCCRSSNMAQTVGVTQGVQVRSPHGRTGAIPQGSPQPGLVVPTVHGGMLSQFLE